MAVPIKPTEAMIDAILDKIRAELNSTKMFSGKISYNETFAYKMSEDNKVSVKFTRQAYLKMLGLIDQFSSEVGWHGLSRRLSSKDFLIYDIHVYPQIVTGTTVETDLEPYQDWLYDCDDEVFNNRRFHGHSHVNMMPSPSNTDTTWYKDILQGLSDDDYYIFMIMNKQLRCEIMVYDLLNNILYDTKDIDIVIVDDEGNNTGIDPCGSMYNVMWQCANPELLSFIADAKVAAKPYSAVKNNKKTAEKTDTPGKNIVDLHPKTSSYSGKTHPSLSKEDDPDIEAKLSDDPVPLDKPIAEADLDIEYKDLSAVGIMDYKERKEIMRRLVDMVNKGFVKNDHIELWSAAFDIADELAMELL